MRSRVIVMEPADYERWLATSADQVAAESAPAPEATPAAGTETPAAGEATPAAESAQPTP